MLRYSSGTPTFEAELVVRSSELDSFAHVNHAVFLSYLEHGRFEALEAVGFGWSALRQRGWGVYVVRVEIDYLAEAKLFDRLTIRTWAASFRRTSMVLGQEIVQGDAGTRVVEAAVTTVWIGVDGTPMRVPEEVRTALSGEAPEA